MSSIYEFDDEHLSTGDAIIRLILYFAPLVAFIFYLATH